MHPVSPYGVHLRMPPEVLSEGCKFLSSTSSKIPTGALTGNLSGAFENYPRVHLIVSLHDTVDEAVTGIHLEITKKISPENPSEISLRFPLRVFFRNSFNKSQKKPKGFSPIVLWKFLRGILHKCLQKFFWTHLQKFY